MRTTCLQASLVLACAAAIPTVARGDEQDMYRMASALTKLTSAVDAQLLYTPEGASLMDAALLAAATASQPALLTEFSSYRLRVHRFSGAVLLLVCRPDRDQALLEDLSCTAAMDRHHWRDTPAMACAPTLDVAQLCVR